MDSFEATDPLAMLFDIATEFQMRVRRLMAVFLYAQITAVFIVLLGMVGAAVAFLLQQWVGFAIAVGLVLISSVAALWSGSTEDFVLEFRRKLEMIALANSWTPDPRIPEGPSRVDRYLAFLRLDPRYQGGRKEVVDKPWRSRGRSGAEHELTCRFLSRGAYWVWGRETHRVLIREFDRPVTGDDLAQFTSAVQDILNKREHPLTRVVALIPEESMTPELIERAANARLRYKLVGSRKRREIPVELVAETSDGTYLLLPLFYVS